MRTHFRTIALSLALFAASRGVRVEAQDSATSAFTTSASTLQSLSGSDTRTSAWSDVTRMAAEKVTGRSGALRVAVIRALGALELPFLETVSGPGGARLRWTPLFGTRTELLGQPVFTGDLLAPGNPGVWRLEADQPSPASPLLTVITQVPFAAKQQGKLNGYRIGSYPTEGRGRSDRYAPPEGFIEVTPENQDLQISEHFRLRQFLTKDQATVWPKYVALRLQLIDKLELVIQELHRMGIRADRMHVMSGYRTPQYNGPGGDGRATLSRHMYGDAADVWIDNDGDGSMDDLNGDGRENIRDSEVILRAVERVEQKHPELVGGAGVYRANEAHGPFIHIDVRGERSRW